MSPSDVPWDEMGIDPEIANEELEALLAGHGRDKNLDLTRFVDDLSTAFPATTPAAAAHLAAIAEQTQLLADNGNPVARPVSNAVAPALQASRPPKRWRNSMKDKKARILLKVAAPIVAVFAVLGLMGSAGALPRALQHMTHTAGGWVGLSLPSGEDTEGDGTDTTDQGDQNDQGDTTSTDTSDQGDQNDQGDGSSTTDTSDQGDQNDQGGGSSTTDTSDQGDQNDQGDSTGTSGGSSDQGDQNDQGDSTGTSGGGSSENDQGSGGTSQDNQGDSSGDSGSSGSGDNQN